MKKTILTYLKKFSNKDIDGLSLLFDESVILKDWEIFAEGKAEVLDAILNIFNSVDSISIKLDKLYIDGKVATCVIDIVINKFELLKVVDLIKVDNNNKILEISAYKQ